jgi:transcription antitermination factor NusG
MDQDVWYAIRVRAQQEMIASQSLRGRGLEEFLPLCQSRKRWTDRVKVVTRPLISGYVFCRFSPNQLAFVLDAAGCVQAVKCGTSLAPVPDEDIRALRRLVESGQALPHPYMHEGTRVRIRAGAFKDLEGYVQKIKNEDQLIISLYLLQRSVSVLLEVDAVQALR